MSQLPINPIPPRCPECESLMMRFGVLDGSFEGEKGYYCAYYECEDLFVMLDYQQELPKAEVLQ